MLKELKLNNSIGQSGIILKEIDCSFKEVI
jgi:hypothetical protein